MTTIIAENTFTTPKFISERLFTISISGTFDATVSVQRVNQTAVPTAGSPWKTVSTYAVNIEENGIDVGSHWYRIGVAAGDFTSGSAVVAIY
jgi:hypothetical protein